MAPNGINKHHFKYHTIPMRQNNRQASKIEI